MDNYEATFHKKIQYALEMAGMLGQFNVPKDFFVITRVRNEGEKNKLGQVHGYGTTYEMVRLDEMYKDELDRYLKATSVTMKEDKKGIYFITNEFLKKVAQG